MRRPTGAGSLPAFILTAFFRFASRSAFFRLAFAGAVVLMASARPAMAGDARIDAARAHSQEGDAYYKLEKYANAIAEYEQAYLAKPDPSFLYNIAQCHRLMGQGAEAIKFYRRFLKDAPNAPNRAVAEKHIRDLEEAAAHGPQPPASASSPVAPPPATAPPPAAPPTEPVTPLSPPPGAASSLGAPAPTSTPVSTTPIVENTAPPPQSDQSESHPIYSRWWFWTAIGAAVVGGIVIIAATRGGDPACPMSAGFKCQ
ncbi:MAG TPA: tetratricopeptide repeat protein [Polyangia bacterium]|nr:tetratricopeptide repeat protein [Polyangia bacterium]